MPGEVSVPKHLASRLLYSNPVCLLTTKTKDTANVMTITWLTCLNNQGKILCSIQNRRYTLTLLQKNPKFVLNIPVKGMEELILFIGSFHGTPQEPKIRKIVDKFPNDFHLCEPGWKPMQMKSNVLAIRQCVAHVVCQVEASVETAGHRVLTCQIQEAWVQQEYWHDGKLFIGSPSSPPLLTFLGSQQFAEMRPIPTPEEENSDDACQTDS